MSTLTLYQPLEYYYTQLYYIITLCTYIYKGPWVQQNLGST